MRLKRARVRKYRSIIDSGDFDIEEMKTILVGPNEAGKSALLQALQQLNAPPGIPGFHPLRDYPRSLYDAEIVRGRAVPNEITVVEAEFGLEEKDRARIPDEFKDCTLTVGRTLANTSWYKLNGGPSDPQFGDIRTALDSLARFAAANDTAGVEGESPPPAPHIGQHHGSIDRRHHARCTFFRSTRLVADPGSFVHIRKPS